MKEEPLPSWTQCELTPLRFAPEQTWYLAGRAAALAEAKPLRTNLRIWQAIGSLAACAAVWAWIPSGNVPSQVSPTTIATQSITPENDVIENQAPERPRLSELPAENIYNTSEAEFIAVRNQTIARRRAEESHFVFEPIEGNTLRYGSREELERSSL